MQTKLLNVQLGTCGCGLRKLKFGCGVADCVRQKKLAVLSTDGGRSHALKCKEKIVLKLGLGNRGKNRNFLT